jgi:glycosyltransferase involved in cell wall biosynthesis
VALALTLDGLSPPNALGSLVDLGVPIFATTIRGRAYLRERAGYRKAFREWCPDVVHTHGYRADLLAGSAAAAHGIPRVSTLHGFTGGDWKNQLYERLQLRSVRRFDAAVAVSSQIRDRLIRAGASAARVYLIPNAWAASLSPLPRNEARAQLGLPQDCLVIGWVGRLSHEKGADILLEALPPLAELPWVLSVIGDGDQRAALQIAAVRHGFAERVRWHGLVPDASRLYPAFDCLVSSSRTEGSPIVLLEAMGTGVPIVATRVGGVPDLVRSEDGLLVPPENPSALGVAIRAALTDREAALTRSASARDRVARDYAPGAWIDRYAAVYHTILAGRRGNVA